MAEWSILVSATINVIAIYLAVMAALFALETAFPRQRMSFLSRLRGFSFSMACAPFYAAAGLSFSWLLGAIGWHPLLALDLRHLPLAPVSGVFIATAVADFGFYWMHRLQHRLLWRQHRVHHAIRELSALGAYHHITEPFIWTFAVGMAASLFSIDAGTIPYIGLLLTLQGYNLHSATRLSLGPLRYLIGDNRFHRIHHSLDPKHFDKNFSGFTPLWDIVFGTAYFPKHDEWPQTGLADEPETVTTLDWLSRPFTSRAMPSAR